MFVSVAYGQVPDAPDTNVANIPANHTEARVATYTLPDPLKLANGERVFDAKTWVEKRRPELVRLFAENQFGRIPATAPKVTWEVVSTDRNALGGAAVMKKLAGHMGGPTGPAIDVTLYTPAKATGPVPVLVSLSFNFGPPPAPNAAEVAAINQAFRSAVEKADPVAKTILERYPNIGIMPAPMTVPMVVADASVPGSPAQLIAHGFAYATVNYSSIETDTQAQPNLNLARKLALAPGQTTPAPDEWGAISAWAWGLSRVVDYLETDSAIDAKRVAIMGVSRLGKTVLWAGANDPRIALVIASCSGEGGAALSRRNYGETIAHLVAPSRYPYQFAANYAKYAEHPDQSPIDGHLLVALIAPRPVLLQTGNTDTWSDPKGEFLAAIAAEPVYKLLGKQGLETDQMPLAGQPILHTMGYLMHAGGHGTLPGDWETFLQFLRMHLQQK